MVEPGGGIQTLKAGTMPRDAKYSAPASIESKGSMPATKRAERAIGAELVGNVLQGPQLAVAADVPRVAGRDPRVERAVPDVQIMGHAVGAGGEDLIDKAWVLRCSEVAVEFRADAVQPHSAVDHLQQPRVPRRTRRGR